MKVTLSVFLFFLVGVLPLESLKMTLKKCLVTIVESSFKKGLLIWQESSEEIDNLLQDISASTRIVLRLFKHKSKKEEIVIDEESMLSAILFIEEEKESFLNRITVGIKSRILVVCFMKGSLSDPESVSLKYIHLLWTLKRLMHVTILIVQNEDSYHFYTWFPFQESQCRNVSEAVLIDTWVNGMFKKNQGVFPEKISNNFNKCSLYAMYDERGLFVNTNKTNGKGLGVDLQMVTTITQMYNLTLTRVALPKGLSFRAGPDGPGALGQLINSSLDIAFRAFSLTYRRNLIAKPLYPYYEKRYVWYYSRPDPLPSWIKIIKPFSYEMWWIILFYQFSFPLVYWISTKYLVKTSCSITTTFLNMLGLTLGLPSFNTPNKTSLRFAFLLFCIYAMHMKAAYEASLVVELTKPDKIPPIDSAEEFIDLGYSLGVLNVFLGFCADIIARIQKQNPERVFYPLTVLEFFQTANLPDSKVFGLFPDDFYNMKLYMKKDKFGYPVEITKSAFVIGTGTSFMNKRSILYDFINKKVQLLVESGIIGMWHTKFYLEYAKDIREPDAENVVLSMDHLIGAFSVLFLGLGTAFCVFICEVFSNFYVFRLKPFSIQSSKRIKVWHKKIRYE